MSSMFAVVVSTDECKGGIEGRFFATTVEGISSTARKGNTELAWWPLSTNRRRALLLPFQLTVLASFIQAFDGGRLEAESDNSITDSRKAADSVIFILYDGTACSKQKRREASTLRLLLLT